VPGGAETALAGLDRQVKVVLACGLQADLPSSGDHDGLPEPVEAGALARRRREQSPSHRRTQVVRRRTDDRLHGARG
jgi:hypothetical protein